MPLTKQAGGGLFLFSVGESRAAAIPGSAKVEQEHEVG